MSDCNAHGSRAQAGPTRRLVGDEAKSLIEAQLAAHSGGIFSVLSRYKLRETVEAWHGMIRAVEEFINVPIFGIDDQSVARWLFAIPLDGCFVADPGPVWVSVQQVLSPHVERDIVQRFLQTMLQVAAIAHAFRAHGQTRFGKGISLDTVGDAMTYFQSRRRHFVSLLYTMPYGCKGSAIIAPLDELNVFLPQVVEHSCVTTTGLHQQLVLADVLPDFSLEVDDVGALASHEFEALEGYFLEPERASIQVMGELRPDQIAWPKMELLDPRKIFSAAELRNSVKLISATYAAFGLNDSDFATMALLIVAFSRQCRDDYVITISKAKFGAILHAQTGMDPSELESLLINKPSDYATNTNAFEPFIDIGDEVISNVNLLSRFLYAFKNIHLGSRRRFHIHAGFIFEDMIKRDLHAAGFTVTDIKRINRKEFDVVTTLGDVIYNFQCKNNWIDLAKVESDRTLFIRYNRSLINYYRRALAKEKKREHLLKSELGLDKIEHYVISRFPVIGADPRVINYNMIDGIRVVIGSVF
jgi:hypothetical protein